MGLSGDRTACVTGGGRVAGGERGLSTVGFFCVFECCLGTWRVFAIAEKGRV